MFPPPPPLLFQSRFSLSVAMARFLIAITTVCRPPNPLRVLGEFLIQKSNEVEGDVAAGTKKSPD